MSIKSQQSNMKAIHSLVSRDLGYIHGRRENGSNGAKKQFLSKSAAFLRALCNDLSLKEAKVTTNPGGIAVSGDITLMGIWGDDNGLYFQISQSLMQSPAFLYREIRCMKDYIGGRNQWILCNLFANGEYEQLVKTLLGLRKPAKSDKREVHHVA